MNPKLLKMLLCVCLFTISYQSLKAQNFTKKIKFSSVKNIEIDNGLSVILQQSSDEFLEIKGNKNLVNNVKVEKTDDGTLHVGYKNDMVESIFNTNKPVKVYISFNKLKNLLVDNGSAVTSHSKLIFDDIKLKVMDGSALKINLIGQKVNLSVEDGSSISLLGKSKFLNIVANDGSSINAENLEATDVIINANDGSSVIVNSNHKLTAKANEGSAISYVGSPIFKDVQASTSSVIARK